MKWIAILLLSTLQPGITTKKQQLLEICRKYMPEQYAFLEAYSETEVASLAPGDSLAQYFTELPTIIHEANHAYNNEQGPAAFNARSYYTTGTGKFEMETFPVFSSAEINELAPLADRKKLFRYPTYITSRTPNLDSRVNGIFGLLEEMNAYYHSLHTSLQLFYYLKDRYGFTRADLWVEWLGSISSFRYALNEFSIFISWYLQAAKKDHPAIYNRIVKHEPVKKMYQFLHKANQELAGEYAEQLEAIAEGFGNTIHLNKGSVFITATGQGYGLGEDRLQQTKEILQKPEHRILQVLLQ